MNEWHLKSAFRQTKVTRPLSRPLFPLCTFKSQHIPLTSNQIIYTRFISLLLLLPTPINYRDDAFFKSTFSCLDGVYRGGIICETHYLLVLPPICVDTPRRLGRPPYPRWTCWSATFSHRRFLSLCPLPYKLPPVQRADRSVLPVEIHNRYKLSHSSSHENIATPLTIFLCLRFPLL